MLGLNNWNQPADRPLPPAFEPPPLVVPETPADVKIEPIAERVPAECFYVRFGSFANFLWLQDTLDKWGGDVQNLVALRRLDHDMKRAHRAATEHQARHARPAAGRYGHRRRGDHRHRHVLPRRGGYGILFQARNNLLLGTS